jgi:glucose/arabinose dehydrogenase
MRAAAIIALALTIGGCSKLLGFDSVTLDDDAGGSTIDANPNLPDADPNAPDAPMATYDARPPADAVTQTCTPVTGTNVTFQSVATGLSRPVFVTSPPGDARLFVVEQAGRIRIIREGTVLAEPFLDIRSAVYDTGNEQGLLGLAFHPQFATNGRFFVNYTAQSPQGDTVVAEYSVSSDPNIANTTETRLITINQDFSNHNGGMIDFGPDGYLWIGMGDGGSGDDPNERAEDISQLLGKMLRIDVNTGSPYGIPSDNPYVGMTGRDEIWALGLRNPWRWSFDRSTGDLYIGDVGQGAREEIDVMASTTPGVNYGWDVREGTICHEPTSGCPTAGLTDPLHDYSHTGGRCSVTGGYVYRGSCFPDIAGWYFFADYCTGEIWATQYDGSALSTPTLITSSGGNVSSFGQDATGELYVVDLNGTISRIVVQ